MICLVLSQVATLICHSTFYNKNLYLISGNRPHLNPIQLHSDTFPRSAGEGLTMFIFNCSFVHQIQFRFVCRYWCVENRHTLQHTYIVSPTNPNLNKKKESAFADSYNTYSLLPITYYLQIVSLCNLILLHKVCHSLLFCREEREGLGG